MPPIAPGTPLHAFVDSIRKAASEVFSEALSSSWSAEISADDSSQPTDASHVCFSFAASGSLQGTVVLQIKNADALMFAQKFLAEPVEATAELDSGRKGAVEELLRQVAGVAATAMKSLFGEVQLQVSMTTVPAWLGVTVVFLLSEPSSAKLPVELRLSTELLASVSAAKVTTTVNEANPKPESQLSDDQSGLGRLLGVNLNLSLRFGQRSLTLREILDLNSGAVIELDRQVQEPADLLLGERVIARGEVIIVDGNYGIRVTEVVGT